MIIHLYVFSAEKVLDSCTFRDEDDDCTYHYTVENSKDPIVKELEVQVLKKKGELQVGYVPHSMLSALEKNKITYACKIPFTSIVLVMKDRYLKTWITWN